jgi:hypothetical protein
MPFSATPRSRGSNRQRNANESRASFGSRFEGSNPGPETTDSMRFASRSRFKAGTKCLHPRDDSVGRPIQTVAFVSLMSAPFRFGICGSLGKRGKVGTVSGLPSAGFVTRHCTRPDTCRRIVEYLIHPVSNHLWRQVGVGETFVVSEANSADFATRHSKRFTIDRAIFVSPYPAKAGTAVMTGSRRLRMAPPSMPPVLSWS